jgi:hypothetical protein
MKKTFFISTLVLVAILAGSCEDELETNYTDDGHYGNIIIHNEANTGNITRIIIDSDSGWSNESRYYNDIVNIAPGKSSSTYELELGWSRLFPKWNGYKVTITVDSANFSAKILSYEDIVNHLYYDGTKLEER